MARFIFTQTVRVEKEMDMSFGIDAANFEEAQNKLHELLETESGKFRVATDVMDSVVTDDVSTKRHGVIDGKPTEFICFKQRGWKEIGITDMDDKH